MNSFLVTSVVSTRIFRVSSFLKTLKEYKITTKLPTLRRNTFQQIYKITRSMMKQAFHCEELKSTVTLNVNYYFAKFLVDQFKAGCKYKQHAQQSLRQANDKEYTSLRSRQHEKYLSYHSQTNSIQHKKESQS